MADDPYLQAVALLVSRGFNLQDIWGELPWIGDMPEDFIIAFAMIHKKFDDEKLQQFGRFQ